MESMLCHRCDQNKGINYYIKLETEDRKPYYKICKDCREENVCEGEEILKG